MRSPHAEIYGRDRRGKPLPFSRDGRKREDDVARYLQKEDAVGMLRFFAWLQRAIGEYLARDYAQGFRDWRDRHSED